MPRETLPVEEVGPTSAFVRIPEQLWLPRAPSSATVRTRTSACERSPAFTFRVHAEERRGRCSWSERAGTAARDGDRAQVEGRRVPDQPAQPSSGSRC